MKLLEIILSALENDEDWWMSFDSKVEAKLILKKIKYIKIDEEIILYLATLLEFDSSEIYTLSEIYRQCLKQLENQVKI